MTIGERIKFLRKTLKLTQTEFGQKIGVKQTTIGMYENDLRSVTERSISDICRVYKINENWIKFGEGNIFFQDPLFSFDNYIQSKTLSAFDIAIIKGYLDLDEQTRKSLFIFLNSTIIQSNRPTIYDSCPKTPDELENNYPPITTQNKKIDL